jgi:signal transduction histidine kinase
LTGRPERGGSARAGDPSDVADLARVLGHELAEIVALLDGYTAQLLDSAVTDDAEAVSRLSSTTARLRLVYEDLLELAKVASAPLTPSTVDPAAVLAAAHRRVAPEVDIDIPALPPVVADAEQLEALFMHVLRSTTRGPSATHANNLTVRGSRAGGQVRLDIGEDAATSSAPASHPVPLLQGSLVGRGIVLAVSSQIARRNGGRLWLDGESGSGRTISLTLPAAEA